MDQALIAVNIQDQHSIKQAIETFSLQMQQAYQSGELINRVGGFISHEQTQLRPCDLADQAQFKAIFLLNPEAELNSPVAEPLNDEQRQYLINNPDYLRLSQIVVFQHALQYDELKPLLVTFCQELVAFSIRVNSSNELFFSSDMLFGLYLIILVAEKYPEYAYLIGEYYPQNSDYNQIMYHGADYMAYLFHQHGYSNLFLDAQASCRFQDINSCIHSHFYDADDFIPDLLSCFLADENRYLYYKNSLIESFKRRPQDPDDFDPLTTLEENFDTICDDYGDPDFRHPHISHEAADNEFDELIFHGRTIEQERKAVKAELFAVVKHIALKDLHYFDKPIASDTITLADIHDDPFYQEYHEDNKYQTNKSFFLDCFDNGEQILAYIEENKYPQVLDQLQPINFRKLTLEHKSPIFKRFEYYGSGFMQLSPDLDQDITLEDIIEHFLVTYQNPDSFDIDDDGEDAQNDKCLRTLDVLVRLLGKKELTGDEIQLISREFELCSPQQASERFTLQALTEDDIRRRVFHLINEPMVDHFGLVRLNEIHQLYLRDKTDFAEMLPDIIRLAHHCTPDDLLAVLPALNQTDYAWGAQLLAVAYILSQQDNGFFADPDLEPLWAFYNEHIFKRWYFEIERMSALSHSFDEQQREKAPLLLDNIRSYIDARGKSTGGLMAKLMKKPADTDTAISPQQILPIARELVFGEPQEREAEETGSALFISDDIGMVLASMLYAARVAKGPLKKQLLAAYELMLQLFPHNTLLASFLEFSDGGKFFSKSTAEEAEAFCDYLSDLKINEKYAFLFRIVLVQRVNEYEEDINDFCDDYGLKPLYQTVLNIYRAKDDIDPDDAGMLAARERKISAAVSAAVDLLTAESRNKFLSFV